MHRAGEPLASCHDSGYIQLGLPGDVFTFIFSEA
jgi:hypothetical protein